MPVLTPPAAAPPTHVHVFAYATVAGFPYTAWKTVSREQWEASTPADRHQWRTEARICLLNTITSEKGPAAAAAALVRN